MAFMPYCLRQSTICKESQQQSTGKRKPPGKRKRLCKHQASIITQAQAQAKKTRAKHRPKKTQCLAGLWFSA
jgi:hypothetical protein